MPVDNFTYHKLYGRITSGNGRLLIERPRTVLSGGYIRALSTRTSDRDGYQAYVIETEDGRIEGTPEIIQRGLVSNDQNAGNINQPKLNLAMYSDAKKFPHSGGYVWVGGSGQSQR